MAKTDFEIKTITSKLNSTEALRIVSFYLAQEGEPQTDLGYETLTQAFEQIGKIFNKNPNTIKLTRDAFDNHTASKRVGWQRDLRAGNLKTLNIYAEWDRNDLLSLVKEVLTTTWLIDMNEDNYSILPDFLSEDFPDLEECLKYCKERSATVSFETDLLLSKDFLEQLIENYRKIKSTDTVFLIRDHTISIKTPEENFLAISTIEIGRCWAVIPYIMALKKYIKFLDDMVEVQFGGRRGSGENKVVFKQIPDKDWEKILTIGGVKKVDDYLELKLKDNPKNIKRFKLFLSDTSWSGLSKKLDRSDLLTSAIVHAGDWLNYASDRRGELSIALLETPEANSIISKALISPENKSTPVITPITGGRNLIYYGAPGTGKSYAIKEETEQSQNTVIKTVFHSDTQNSDFMGCLKPSSDDGDVTYTFQSGPFTNALVKALNDPNRMYYLVIEEINRAPAAAVFGEVFQLLDRDKDGRTETGYEVSPTNPMQCKYIKGKVTNFDGKMYIPSNLTLLATMNSSDQAVMPMDTAFKRRWRFEYIPLDFKNACPEGNLKIATSVNTAPQDISWKNFAIEINKILSNEEMPEDRHLGPFFITENELSTVVKSNQALSGKVFMYLWDDILRHKEKHLIFDNKFKTIGALMTAFSNNEPVFNSELLSLFAENEVFLASSPDLIASPSDDT